MERNTFPDIPCEIKINDINSIEMFFNSVKDKKIALDIGCGHGDFMIEFCPNHQDKVYIGIEISRKRTHKTSLRLAKRNINNYYVIAGDAYLILELLFAESSIDEVHINFPDPWQKIRHWKNRLLKPSFIISIIRALKKGGLISFVTDVEEYAVYTSELFATIPGIKNNYETLMKKNIYDSFPTLFYRKMSPLRDINYVSFAKI